MSINLGLAMDLDALGGSSGPPAIGAWNTGDAHASSFTFSNSNRTMVKVGSGWTTAIGSTSFSTGKKVFEIKCAANTSTGSIMPGVCDAGFNTGSYLGSTANSFGLWNAAQTYAGYFGPGTGSDVAPASAVIGDKFTIAVDFDAGNLWLAINGVWFGDPAAGTGRAGYFTANSALFPAMAVSDPTDGTWTLQQSAYTLPTGFANWA